MWQKSREDSFKYPKEQHAFECSVKQIHMVHLAVV